MPNGITTHVTIRMALMIVSITIPIVVGVFWALFVKADGAENVGIMNSTNIESIKTDIIELKDGQKEILKAVTKLYE